MSSTSHPQFPYIEPRYFRVIQGLEASLDILWLEKTAEQGVPSSEQQPVDGRDPNVFRTIVLIRVVVGRQWLDEMTVHEFVTQQAPLDEISNELRRADKTASSTTRDQARVVIRPKVLHRSHCEPPKDTLAQFVHEGSCLPRPVRRIAEILEEPYNTSRAGIVQIPYHGRNTLSELIYRDEPLVEDVFNPVLDLRRDLLILRRILGKGGEQGAYLRGDAGLPIVKTSPLGHGCGTTKSVAGARTHNS